MQKRLKEALENRPGSYILPFFWQHGETEEVLRDYMRAIYEANIREVCVECRPHPDFCGPKWWQDLDIILDEARTRGMRVWILDDDHFPTGHANGAMTDADPKLCKQYLAFKSSEIAGPVTGGLVDVDRLLHPAPSPFSAPKPTGLFGQTMPERHFDDDVLIGLYAIRMQGAVLSDEIIDLTAEAEASGWTSFAWDVPDGHWKLAALCLTRNGGGRPDYINLCDKASVRVLIDAVYEPHYARYHDDFGKTIAGFFSDEPLIGNTPPYARVETLIGRSTLPLIWCEELGQRLSARLGEDWTAKLPYLWFEGEDAQQTGSIRSAYMDELTGCIERNFSRQLGDWCADHGVEYIGHLVEDNNVSFGLGSSLGHYFRGLNGQHFGGVDAIGGQVFPGGEDRVTGPDATFYPNGSWYHFVLGKLGSSHAHIDPRKQGRAMCELFGAYGWGFGVRDMKYLADHMMVRGINRLVPHAFSPKEFPDPDCPPHFYAHGENPEYRHFATLMAYCQRVCHLIDGGRNVPAAALLYEAEAFWAGEAQYTETVARKLLEHQIDFDYLTVDVFASGAAALQDGKLIVNGREYGALVIARSRFLPGAMADFSRAAEQTGFPVIFLDALPEGVSDGEQRPFSGQIVTLTGLATTLRALGVCDARLSCDFHPLRVYHYFGEDHLYLLSNESTGTVFDGEVSLPVSGRPALYDPLANALRPLDWREEDGKTICRLRIEPYELLVLAFGCEDAAAPKDAAPLGEPAELTGWTVSIAASKEYPAFHDAWQCERPEPASAKYPDFSGYAAYETTAESAGGPALLEIEDVRDCALVFVDGVPAGERICPPYRFPLTLTPGKHTLRIEVATNLEREYDAMPGFKFSMQPPSAVKKPTGIVGKVTLRQ